MTPDYCAAAQTLHFDNTKPTWLHRARSPTQFNRHQPRQRQTIRYLVNFSTGLASFEAARRTIEQKDKDATTVIYRGRFLYNERQKAQFRAEINGNVAILRDQSGGRVTLLPLDQFRREVESGARKINDLDWGGCGCFVPSPQMRFDELALEAATPRGAVKRPLAK